MKKLDLLGKRFGMLTVIKEIPKKGRSKWECKCDCGKTIESLSCNLKKANSCGCLRAKNRKTHGLSNHPLYGCWKDMNYRCHNREHPWYYTYGQKGVSVCNRWRDTNPEGLKNFIEDMYASHRKGSSLDKDIKGDGLLYSPSTCIWVTPEENSSRVRPSKLPTYKEKIMSLHREGMKNKDIARIYKVDPSTVSKFIKRHKDF